VTSTVSLSAPAYAAGTVVAADRPSPAWTLIKLRRDGLPPLRFSGRLIARYRGIAPRVALWHDLGLYRTAAASFVVEIVAQHLVPSPDIAPLEPSGFQVRPARCHAALFETLDGALTRLETHDAACDVCPGISAPALSFNDPSIPPALLVMQATALQGFCGDVVRRYKIGVGAMLADIGLRDV